MSKESPSSKVPLHAVAKDCQKVADLISEGSRTCTPQVSHDKRPLDHRLEEFKDWLISGSKSALELIDPGHRRHPPQGIVIPKLMRLAAFSCCLDGFILWCNCVLMLTLIV